MNITSTELAIEHTAAAIGSGLKALLHFFAANTSALTQAAVIAETITGNAELAPLTEMVGKAVQASSTVLDTVNQNG